eukprot:TRINITY_DN43591_c0_g1_i1.p1 TRINITY_DN43591_c0_g1~~TRINITY_DN43591_c0_g1_i1.p1  ORF type:complete len:660 (+),score=217.55 TRINITY_DN43591_c0_g1_i1:79-1980(+)
MSTAGWESLFAALSGGEGAVSEAAIRSAWEHLPQPTEIGISWLDQHCSGPLRTAAEVRQLAQQWCLLPPARTESEALSALTTAAVVHTVAVPLAGPARGAGPPKVSKRDLRHFLESLDVTPVVTLQEVDRALDIADVQSSQKTLTLSECADTVELLMADRKDVTLTAVATAAADRQKRRASRHPTLSLPAGVGERQQSSGQGAFGRRRASLAAILQRGSPTRSPGSPKPGVLRRGGRKTPSPEPEDPGSPLRKGLSFRGSPTTPERGRRASMFSKGKCSICDELMSQQVQLHDELSAANGEAQRRGQEIERLNKLLDRARRGSSPTVAPPVQVPQAALAQVEELRKQLQQSQSECEDALRRLDEQQACVEQREKELASVRGEVRAVHAELEQWRERAQYLDDERRQQQDADTRRIAELSKLRTELSDRTQQAAAAEQKASAAALEVERLRITNESIALGSPRSEFGAATTLFSEDIHDNEQQVVFLNPPGWVQSVATENATCFPETGQIYYEFRKNTTPNQLVFDVVVTASAVTEYITVRDMRQRRALAMVIDQCALVVSGTTVRVDIVPGVWTAVTVTFDWHFRMCSLHVGTQLVSNSIPFRDRASEGVNVFDAYPRRSGGVGYANIRFVTD